MSLFQKEKKYKVLNSDVADCFVSNLETDKDISSEYRLSSKNGKKILLPTSGSLTNYFFIELIYDKEEKKLKVSFAFFSIVKFLLVLTLLVSPSSWIIISIFEIETPIILKWSLVFLPFVQVVVFYLFYLAKMEELKIKFNKMINKEIRKFNNQNDSNNIT